MLFKYHVIIQYLGRYGRILRQIRITNSYVTNLPLYIRYTNVFIIIQYLIMGTDPFFRIGVPDHDPLFILLCDPFPDPDPPLLIRSFYDPDPDPLFLTRSLSRSRSDR